ncbi:NADPH-dependent 7-cyano-7-deazaguanine reductase QueF [Motilimonas sp. 1_MG-2023]|uniref:NADPH-dependent 7-cyano-7-deazaguanine reductase QueF n=1 Tax=Motilimonas sp. 1_MG-2023 TaxID=3062672 RepID=UPI0026E1ABDB|nr:NADPH-dependent 7-cyano-7-deazaguanine reductase QueF [Motilimonas sp. 1_MG-2023]MDO6527807.1 NADPH-dependent 7-cyano-7-deazaguanine reductase QueF [Motilimonas sp. 1_MG-2023]
MKKSSRYENASILDTLSLGQDTQYDSDYNPALLQAVPRSLNRDDLQLQAQNLPFQGFDLWGLYELSWLNSKGKPVVATAHCKVDANSENLIESKSFKLYLNSLNLHKFDSHDAVLETLTRDLSTCAQGKVEVTLHTNLDQNYESLGSFAGTLIDELDIEVTEFAFKPEYLKNSTSQMEVNETLYSHLLKSNCLVTNQPDWGSVLIKYQGPKINQEQLLRYLISFRQHNEFHEQCVERIFQDINHYCKPTKLTVFARYTRRGGLDINPFRSNFESGITTPRLLRQ